MDVGKGMNACAVYFGDDVGVKDEGLKVGSASNEGFEVLFEGGRIGEV